MSVDVQAIVEGVRARDYTVQLRARGAGAAPVAALSGLLGDPDEEVRQLAVHCLAETGDPSAAGGLAAALFDPDPQVAMAAARALHAFTDPSIAPALLQAYDRAAEPAVRREVALVLGRVAGSAELLAMRQRWETEASEEAKEGLTVTLARCGDDDAREAFERSLRASAGRDRLRWLQHAEFVAQRWLLPALGEVLDDQTPVLRVGVDARPDRIDALRACDLALNLIARITGARLSFPVTLARNYTDAELDEARRLVRATPP